MTGTLNLVGYGLSAIGPAIATGMIFAAYISGVARQPEARSVLQPIAFLGFALAEALALFGLVLAYRRINRWFYCILLVVSSSAFQSCANV